MYGPILKRRVRIKMRLNVDWPVATSTDSYYWQHIFYFYLIKFNSTQLNLTQVGLQMLMQPIILSL